MSADSSSFYKMKMIFYYMAIVLIMNLVSTNGVLSCPSNCSCSTVTNTVLVNCSRGGLTVIPKDFPNDTSIITLEYNHITTIEEGEFRNTALVIEINLRGNNITIIQKGVFEDLPRLKYIFLDHNQITTIQQGTFKDLPALVVLSLDHNQITTIQQGTFKDLPALVHLLLNENQITTIRQGTFKDLPVLSGLSLYDNQISTIENGAFESLTKIRILSLSYQNISTIHKGVFKDLRALIDISLEQNHITTIQQGMFTNLTALEYINLRSNKITTLQQGAFKDLPALHSIFFFDNKVTTIENGAFENLPALKEINLSNQNITTIHTGAFKDLPSLVYMSLLVNPISTLQQGTFKDLPALFYLYLGIGKITTIQNGAFENLPALERLYLSNENISTIHKGAFKDLPALTSLHLQNNQITRIQPNMFEDLPELRIIELKGNKLRFVRNDTFARNIHLDTLHVDLYCDCNIPFWSWLKSKSFTNENVTCLDRNVQLSSLTTIDFDNCTYNACQYIDYCSNGGSCSQDSSGDLTCSCVVDWTGATCTESANPCIENVDKFHTYWNKTAESTLATLACTDEHTGNASRYCRSDGKWEEPNYSKCISSSIEQVKELTDKLLSGASDYDNVTTILNKLENITRDNNEIRSGDLLTSSDILNKIAKYVTNHTEELSVYQLEIFGSLCDNLLHERNHQSWGELNNEGSAGVTSLVNAVTEYNDALNEVIDGEYSLVVAKENVVMEVGKTSSDEITVPDHLTSSDSWISESATEITLKKNICSGLTGYSSTFYRNISHLFPKYLILNGDIRPFNGSYGVNSIIAEFTVHGTTCSDYALIIKFDHLLGNYSKPLCGHWNFSAPNTVNGAWSTFGSRVADAADSYTICEYNHTTNFAILMSPGRTPLPHLFPLSLISAIGCGVSILFLVITIIIHIVFWRDIKNAQTKTMMNLCVALILSYIIFLAAITQTENKVVCSAVAVALHYMFLTDFALMLAEGILFVEKLVFLFKNSSIVNKLIPVCWIVPAGIVGISAGVTKLKGYGNDQFCWLSLETNLVWAFIGPALLVIMINIIVIIIAVYKLMTIQAHATKTTKEKSKIGLKGIRVMLPLFGVMWIVGTFSLNEDLVMFQYLFAIFNSLQGLFIFVFNCCLTDKVRKGYREYKRRNANPMNLKLSTVCTNNDNLKTVDEQQNKCTDEMDETI